MAAGAEGLVAAPGPAHPPVPRVDFSRPLVCLLGLPFDAIDIGQAVERIRRAAREGRRCFVSTPNLNFVMTARFDATFRGSVLRSDLSLVDGMPLVWAARLLGLPLPGRVSGADVFEALQDHAGPPVTVFLFGGPPGVAARACEAINRRAGGLRCVGFDEAGYGSVESMSADDRIEKINRSGAQFVIASLGASKGQAWLERNADRLNAPVLSHLGAVLNFAAGSVQRAPRWMAVSGLEWAWRIKEEPALWRRYWRDGIGALWLLLTRVIPDAIATRGPGQRAVPAREPARLQISPAPPGLLLALSGSWHGHEATLRSALTRCAAEADHLRIDLTGAAELDNAAIALLLIARGWFEARGGFEVVGASRTLSVGLRRKLATAALLGADR